ncbi:MAG: response regulator [Chloroflexi bacterium]|nr:response regulator [Chloroflexota bacterium]
MVSGSLPIVQEMFDLGYRTMMAVPLVFEGNIIGTLILLSLRERQYSDYDMAMADRIGNMLSGALATFKLATERDRAQLALSESDTRFRQIADSISGVFWLVELDPRRLIYASPNAEEVWGLPLADIYADFGKIFRNIHPEDREMIQRDSNGSDKTGYLDIEYRIIMQDGSVRWIRSRGFPVKETNGEVFRMSGFAEDVTDRKMEMARITEAGRLLSVGELASGVAHEINNPLAAIDLYAESLMGQGLPAPVIKDLKVISDQGKRAATIVRNLLQFARKSSPEVAEVDARKFIERCLALKTHDFRVNNISASTNVLLDHPEIAIDEQLMTQVLVNVLSNAEHACVAAHGRGHISISVRETGGSTRISISDDGPGIPAADLSKVFDPFFTTKESGHGTGLGLSVSYGIIAQLGGSLWAESDGGSGSTFHIEVPSTTDEQLAESPNDSGAAGLPEKVPGPSLRLLVVDDEPDLRNIIVRLLERRNHKVDAAGDGDEAWDKLQDQSYDCIMLDLRMAGTGGQELFQRLNAANPAMAGKIIFLTGDMANTSTRSFLDPLANLVLQKPVSIGDLEQAISSVTGNLQR